MDDKPITAEDVKAGDFEAKRADQFASRDRVGEDKVDDGEKEKPAKAKKLNSDYAIKKDDEAAQSGKLELGYDQPSEEDAAKQEAREQERQQHDEQRQKEETYVAAVIETLTKSSEDEQRTQEPLAKAIDTSLSKAEEAWSRVPQVETGDPEKPFMIPAEHRKPGEEHHAIKEAEEALHEAKNQISELQQALAKLSEIRAAAGDAMPEITEGMSDLESQLSDLTKLSADLAAQITMAKNGYPHNIGALLAHARQLGNSASTKADDVKAEAEKAYTELKNEIYSSYQEEYGKEAVSAAAYLASENSRLADIDRDVGSFDKKLQGALRRRDLEFAQNSEVAPIIAQSREVPKAKQQQVENSNDELLEAAKRKGILSEEQFKRLHEYSQKGLIDKEHFDQLRAAIESGDKSRIEAARTIIEQAIEHKGQQHTHFSGLHMAIEKWSPEERKAWLDSDAYKQWSAGGAKGRAVSKEAYDAIIAKGKSGADLTPEEKATIRVYKAEEAGKTITGLAAIVSHGKAPSKELSRAQQADIDRAWGKVYAASGEDRLDALKGVLARQANYGLISAEDYNEAMARFNSKEEGAAMRVLAASFNSAEEVEKLRAGGNDYMLQAIDRATAARYDETAVAQHSRLVLESNKRQYQQIQATADLLSSASDFKDLKQMLIASGGMIPDGVQAALQNYAREAHNMDDAAHDANDSHRQLAEQQLHEAIAASQQEAVKTGNDVKAVSLKAYRGLHSERYQVVVDYYKKQGIDITKPEDLAKVDIAEIKPLSPKEYSDIQRAMNSRSYGAKEVDGWKGLSQDQQTSLALAEFKGFIEGSVIIREASKALVYDQTIGGGHIHKEFLARQGTKARLGYLEELGMIDKNNPIQQQIGKNILRAFKGRDNELIEALVGMQSSDPELKKKYGKVFAAAMLEKGEDGVVKLLKTDLDIVLHRARNAAQEAADKATMEHYAKVLPSTGLQSDFMRQRGEQGDDLIINPHADTDRQGQEIYQSTYNHVYLMSLMEAASRDPRLAKDLSPIFQTAEQKGVQAADDAAREASARRSSNDVKHIGFMSGNRQIHEAIEQVAQARGDKKKLEGMDPNVIGLINDLKNYSGDSIQRMRFIEELRAEMKLPKISPEELEMLAESIKGADTLEKVSQAMERLSTPQGVDQAQQSSKTAEKKSESDTGGSTASTQSSTGGNSDRATTIVAEIRNMSDAKDALKYAHSANATVQAAVQAVFATAEYKRIDREATLELGRAATLDPTRSAFSNAAAINHLLNHTAVISTEAYKDLKAQQQQSGAVSAENVCKMAAYEMRALVQTALETAARVTAQVQAEIATQQAKGTNIAHTQATTRMETQIAERTQEQVKARDNDRQNNPELRSPKAQEEGRRAVQAQEVTKQQGDAKDAKETAAKQAQDAKAPDAVAKAPTQQREGDQRRDSVGKDNKQETAKQQETQQAREKAESARREEAAKRETAQAVKAGDGKGGSAQPRQGAEPVRNGPEVAAARDKDRTGTQVADAGRTRPNTGQAVVETGAPGGRQGDRRTAEATPALVPGRRPEGVERRPGLDPTTTSQAPGTTAGVNGTAAAAAGSRDSAAPERGGAQFFRRGVPILRSTDQAAAVGGERREEQRSQTATHDALQAEQEARRQQRQEAREQRQAQGGLDGRQQLHPGERMGAGARPRTTHIDRVPFETPGRAANGNDVQGQRQATAEGPADQSGLNIYGNVHTGQTGRPGEVQRNARQNGEANGAPSEGPAATPAARVAQSPDARVPARPMQVAEAPTMPSGPSVVPDARGGGIVRGSTIG